MNLSVHTYDVTLLKDLTKFDYFSAYKPSIAEASDVRIKVLKIDLERQSIYFVLSCHTNKAVFAISLEKFEDFLAYVNSYGN